MLLVFRKLTSLDLLTTEYIMVRWMKHWETALQSTRSRDKYMLYSALHVVFDLKQEK